MDLIKNIELDPNSKVFAVGDIHGCLEELEKLISMLKLDGLTQDDTVVFLGDYIDRGPSSRGVIDFLIQFKKDYPKSLFLKGNHEDMLLDWLGLGGNHGAFCIRNGGDKFFEDYGFDKKKQKRYFKKCTYQGSHQLRGGMSVSDLRNLIPKEHLDFFSNLDNALLTDEFLFVHAGIDPFFTLDEQTEEDLFWVRDAFLMYPHNISQMIIHGHTPQKLPCHDEEKNRVNIDTGCFKGPGHHLSAIELRSMKFLSTPSRQVRF